MKKFMVKTKSAIANKAGEANIGMIIGIVIVVVLGVALLTALTAIYGDSDSGLLKAVKDKILGSSLLNEPTV